MNVMRHKLHMATCLAAAAGCLLVFSAGCPTTGGGGDGEPPEPPAEAVLAGDWQTDLEDGGTATFTFDEEGNLTQISALTAEGTEATLDLDDATSTVDGENVTVTFPTDGGEVTFAGTLEGQTLTGSLSLQIALRNGDLEITIPAGELELTQAEAGEGEGEGENEGTLAGTVTNSITGEGVTGVTVTLDPAVEGLEVATGEDGTYSATVPTGEYALTFGHANFEAPAEPEPATVVAGETTTVDVALTPVAAVVLTASVEGDAIPGGTVTATATTEVLDGASEVESITWTQSNSVEVTIGGANTETATVTLPETAVYKAELFKVLAEPPIGEDELPENVVLPEGEFPGGLQDRFQVVGLNPFALEETALVTLTATVVTNAGETFTTNAEIHTELPWKAATGLRNVPVGIPVLLWGKTQEAYDWALDTPDGAAATLMDEDSQGPYFEPDMAGTYTVTATDTTGEEPANVTLEITAGAWVGMVGGIDVNGRPVASSACTTCHAPGGPIDMFTPWAQSGHAEIFTNNLNTSNHYSTACLNCHTVGFDTEVDNGGFDDSADYDAFLAEFTTDGSHFHPDEGNWDTMVENMPTTAQLANVQCENCHGPQEGAHTQAESRVSISSDVCAVCHGEPLRHGRFQQWQLSGHANYDLAIDEHDSGSCARCHTGNGFMAWLPILLDDDEETDPLADVEVTWTADETHPITCVICHDPHDVGTISGDDTDATVRLSGDTPPLIAGFTATEVGSGAMCMTCHNSRRGLRNDDTFDATKAEGDAARAPHGSAQTDVLFGENAYFVTTGTPGAHATGVADTCVDCHMKQTPPPDLLAYNLGGTNHTFFAGADICVECHGDAIDGPAQQAEYTQRADDLQGRIEGRLLAIITELTEAGNTIQVSEEDIISDASTIADLEFGEFRGRQAITVTLADGMVVGPARLPDVRVLDGGGEDTGELYDFVDDRLAKAGWNWNLYTNDGSQGVHNPTFIDEMLDASIDAMIDLAGE